MASSREQEDVLQFLRVQRMLDSGAPYMFAPWSVITPADSCTLVIADGEPCFVKPASAKSFETLRSGGLCVTLREMPLVACSSTGVPPMTFAQISPDMLDWPPPTRYRVGGRGPQTNLFGARFRLAEIPPSLLSHLPPWLIIEPEDFARDPVLRQSAVAFRNEIDHWRPAQATIVARLIESLMVQIIRLYASRAHLDGGRVFLRALGDRYVAKAISLIAEQSPAAWAVGTLAKAVGLSHSSFTRRFHAQVGEAPNTFLQRKRMSFAMQLLRESDLSMWDVAERSGYVSVAAFSRAFHQAVGQPPATYRRVSRSEGRRNEQ